MSQTKEVMEKTRKKYYELSATLIMLVIAAFYYNTQKFGIQVGLRVLLVVSIAVGTDLIVELLFGRLKKKSWKDIFLTQFPWITGLIFALTIPVNTNLYVVFMTTVIAVIFGKVLFGGFGQNIFNPASIGRAIVGSSFSNAFVSTVFQEADTFTSASPVNVMNTFQWLPTGSALQSKAFDGLTIKDMFLGTHYGAMGETFIVLLIIIAIFLIVRRVIHWRIPVIYIGTQFILAWGIGLLNGVTSFTYPLMFVMSGGIVFAGVYLLNDPITSPKQNTGKVIFAFGAAILTVLIRLKASAPDGVIYAVLIMNMLTPLIDDTYSKKVLEKKKLWITTISILVITCLSILGLGYSVDAVEPKLSLGQQTTLLEEGLNTYEVTNIEEKSMDNKTEYTVSVQGYGLHAEYPSPDYKENIFVITIDGQSNIVSITMQQFGDTKGVGDAINDPMFFDLFVGKNLLDETTEYDTVSSATMTSHSLLSALKEVQEQLGK